MGIRVNHTGICVSDMERSLAFYEGILGLELMVDIETDGGPELDAVVGMAEAKGRVVWLGAGDTVIELWQWYQPAGRDLPADHRPADRGLTHFALQVDDVDDLYRRVVEGGFHANVEPQDLGLHKTTYIRGPDGEIIEILEDRVTPEWLAAQEADALQRRRTSSA